MINFKDEKSNQNVLILLLSNNIKFRCDNFVKFIFTINIRIAISIVSLMRIATRLNQV